MAISSARPLIDFHKALYFGCWGAGGGLAGSLLGEMVGVGAVKHASRFEVVITVGLWFAVIGGLIALALLAGTERYSGRALVGKGSATSRISLGALFGAISGFVSGGIAQAIFSEAGASEPLRVLCWGVAGGLLGFAVSFQIPNLTAIRGGGGGFIGGVAGGIMFLAITMLLGEASGRLAGVTAIGFAIGLMITLADAVFRKAWLEVQYGPKEKRTITLGRDRVRVGSERGTCEIFVKNAPPVAYVYRFVDGQVVCEDLTTGRTGPVSFGVPVDLGEVILTPNGTAEVSRAGRAGIPVAVDRPSDAKHFLLSMRDGRRFPLHEGTRLSSVELPGLAAAEGLGVVAEVVRNPSDPSVLGLKNQSDRSWRATLTKGTIAQIEPGRSVRLQTGARVEFGSCEGQIL